MISAERWARSSKRAVLIDLGCCKMRNRVISLHPMRKSRLQSSPIRGYCILSEKARILQSDNSAPVAGLRSQFYFYYPELSSFQLKEWLGTNIISGFAISDQLQGP